MATPPRPGYFQGYLTPPRPVTPFIPAKSVAPTRTVDRSVPFDYEKWYGNDQALQSALRAANALGLEQQGTLAGGAGQLFGRVGELPENLPPELAKLLGPTQLADIRNVISGGNAAGTNALSRLNYDYRLGQSEDANRVAGSGFLRSGAYGQESAKNLRGLTLGQYDTRLAATDALNQLQQTFLSGQRELAGQVGDAVTDAQKRAAELTNSGVLGPTTVTRTVTNPYLNPAAPKQISAPVKVGGTTTFEPKPTAGNYVQQPAPKPVPKAAPYKPPQQGGRALL